MHAPIELGLFPPRQRRFDLRTQEERDDARIAAINRRVAELLKGEWNPERDDNIDEALDNLTDEQREIRRSFIRAENINVKKIMANWVRQYCELMAEQQAEKELEQ